MKKLTLILILICTISTFNAHSFVGWIIDGIDLGKDVAKDADEKVWRWQMLGNAVQALETANTVKQYAHGIKGITDSIKYGIKQLYDVQKDARSIIATLKSLEHLKWTDVADIASMALEVEVNPTKWDLDYFNVVKNSPLKQYFDHPEYYDHPQTDIMGLYKLFGPTLEDLVTMELSNKKRSDIIKQKQALQKKQDEGIENSLVMQETHRLVQLDAANKYEQMGKKFTKKVLEMADEIENTELKMSHGEQLQMYATMDQYSKMALDCIVQASFLRKEASMKTDIERNLIQSRVNTLDALQRAMR